MMCAPAIHGFRGVFPRSSESEFESYAKQRVYTGYTHTRNERARSAVSKRIRDALQRIRDHNPSLGRYLMVTVKTGRTCAYVLDPAEPITWAS